MGITGVNHITINMKDIEKTLWFYTDLLQLEKLNTVNMGDHEITYLTLPGAVRLELIHYYNQNKNISPLVTDGGILRHIAFYINDIEKLYQLFLQNGIEITLPVTYAEKLNCTIMLVKDPNGIELEFVQRQ